VRAADFHAAAEPIKGVMNPPAPAADLTPAPAPRPAADVATAQRLLALLRCGRDARTTKVRRLRRSVRADTYENDLKLSVAIDRVVRELGGGE
jgi:hypothetical protein